MIKFLILLICVLLTIAFITLFERKILRFTQIRKGPNLVGRMGILQPFADGVKLLTKESPQPLVGRWAIILRPFYIFVLSLIIWLPTYQITTLNLNNRVCFILLLRSFVGILTFFTGWGGGRSYSFIGGLRASAQVISYEVILFFTIVLPILFHISFDLRRLTNEGIIIVNKRSIGLISFFPIFFIWVVTILAETNRAPFDLTEGESELVRGFNTEYSSAPFVFLFLGEYGFILFFSHLSRILFFRTNLLTVVFVFTILWIRSNFPRKRYDLLMEEMWIVLFPISCLFLIIVIILSLL